MTNPAPQTLAPMPAPLLDRVVAILEEARGQVVRAVNTQMVWAYWLIGREIVQALQGGDERAAYGQQVLSEVSRQLTQRYGKGFSLANLQNFRKFYLAYSARAVPAAPIQYPAGRELAGSESVQGFSPQLTWSHYRALMRVDNVQARDFYEREAIECGWSKVQLERQIHSFYFERIVAHRGAQGVLPAGRERLPGQPVPAAQVLKSPLVLEFLGLPDTPNLHESKLEDQFKVPGDNPTIGLVLCSEKSEAVVRYSVLAEQQQLFAAKYLLYLPTEEELKRELEQERIKVQAQLLHNAHEEQP